MSINFSPVPVVLFVYKRARHTKATLVALSKNNFAEKTELFIYCDGAKDEKDIAAVEKTRKVVRDFKGFKNIIIIERNNNLGLASSIIMGVSEVLKTYDSVIVLEDDLITSKNFLEFMNRALLYYQCDPKAFSVTGHTFSTNVLEIPKDYRWDTYAGLRASSWSWGTWRDRWECVDWSMKYYNDFIADNEKSQKFNQGGEDLTELLNKQYQKKIDSWAIRFSYAHFIHDCRCIYPTKTLVRNVGLDNTGTHTRLDKRFVHNYIDDEWLPKNFCNASVVDDEITRNFWNVFHARPIILKNRIFRKLNNILKKIHKSIKDSLDRLMMSNDSSSEQIHVLMVNTIQSSGGAARAAYRCFTAMSRLNLKIGYLSLFSQCSENRLYGLRPTSIPGWVAKVLTKLDRLELQFYTKRKRVIFSPAFWANPCRISILSFQAKIIHLHWVSSGILSLEELPELDVPIVWTLHDQWPFTGGCHYSEACDKFKQQCGACPILNSEKQNDISTEQWFRKLDAYSKSDITVVAPSRWIASLAKSSSLFSSKRIEVIPNGLDTEVFYPHDKQYAQSSLGINSELPIILYGAQQVTDNRKGSDLLADAIKMIEFQCSLLVFGEGESHFNINPNVEIINLGIVNDDDMLAKIYSASDLYICPSRVDNLPNTIAEAMACGVPCVAFDTGGLSDMIDHKINGWLATPFEPKSLINGILWILTHENRTSLSQSAREKALSEYSFRIMAERYKSLYDDLLIN